MNDIITNATNEVAHAIRKECDELLAHKNIEISALKNDLGLCRHALYETIQHLSRWSSGLDGELELTTRLRNLYKQLGGK